MVDIAPRGLEELAWLSFLILLSALATALIYGELAVIIDAYQHKANLLQFKMDVANSAMHNLELTEFLRGDIRDFIRSTFYTMITQNEMKDFRKNLSPTF